RLFCYSSSFCSWHSSALCASLFPYTTLFRSYFVGVHCITHQTRTVKHLLPTLQMYLFVPHFPWNGFLSLPYHLALQLAFYHLQIASSLFLHNQVLQGRYQ